MLNGKFYTGLPPNMIERGSTQRNRLQSSIFWPDDTKVDSALETRVKRRNSLQIAQTERPQLRMQSSVSGSGDADVNTKHLFQKEFSKSSIEFLDNLCDEIKPRKPLLLRGNRSASGEVTAKPTALKLPLPENVVNTGYTTAKKKQAFTSKIEFYDYAGDELNNRNNLRRAKMDMNDKKEMERNTKNSPKLQVKNNMHSLSTNEKLYPAERREKVEIERMKNTNFKDDAEIVHKNNMYDEVDDREYGRYAGRGFDEEFEDSGRDLLTNKTNLRLREKRLRGERLRELDYLESRRTVSPEHSYRRERRFREAYEDDYELPDYAPSARYGVAVRRSNSVGRFTSPPKRILRNPIRERRYNSDYGHDGYRNSEVNRANDRYRERDNKIRNNRDLNDADADADVDYIEGCMRNARIRTSPKKHVTYSDDTYSHDDEMPSHSQRPLTKSEPLQNRSSPHMRTGSGQLRHYNSEIDFADDTNEALEEKFMENDMRGNVTTIKPLNVGSNYITKSNNRVEERNSLANKINNNKNANYNNTTSRLNNQTIASAARKITPKMPNVVTTRQNADTTTNDAVEAVEAVGTDVKKHLRSSLCLHNGEIIASDDGGATSAKAPTRNARSTATRQRVSVGLPD